MSREIKIGSFVVIVLLATIWGYTFVKGRNLLTRAVELKVTFDDVTDLQVSSPVLVNGYKIGTVTSIKLNPNDVKKMDITFLVNTNYSIPKDAKVIMKSMGIVSGKGLFIEFSKPCMGDNCVSQGDILQGESRGFIGSIVGEDDTNAYSKQLTETLKNVLTTIGAEGEPGAVNEIMRNLSKMSHDMALITEESQRIIQASSQNINSIIANTQKISKTLSDSNTKIEHIVAHIETLTRSLSESNTTELINNTNETIVSSKATLDQLSKTLDETSTTMKTLSTTLDKVNTKEGTLGMLINDKNLYLDLDKSIKQLELLLQDLRLNPKRYAHFSIFGKKQAEYIHPSEDPVLKANQNK